MSKAVVIPECKKDIGGLKEEISVSPNDKKDGTMGIFSRLLRFESLKRNNVVENTTPTEPLVTYYGVYIPCEIKKGPDEETIHVYKNKSEALEVVRRYKSARFKAFQNRQDAISFALRGAEPVESIDCTDSPLMGEKPYPFKAPSPQELVAVRKSIEAGLVATVRDRVWDNPRYLVSSGNTPAIMQEGCRYNALHVAVKAKNAEMCNLILNTVGNPAFVQTLYGADADDDACKEFAEILLDRYLNTPDKARNETPLHFASCFGADEVVDVLTSFPQCNKNAVNKAGETPRDVICKRVPGASAELIQRIAAHLGERYYVPVLHSEDESAAPAIGTPFTPASPPNLNRDPLSPRLEIRAFAGPMCLGDAAAFRRKWKAPLKPPAFRLNDIAKGLETVGRNLAGEMKIGWKEYWPFLDTFTDLRSVEGLTLLENYLKAKYESACSFVYNDSCIEAHNDQTADDMSFSRLTLSNLSSSPIKDMSPMSELCAALRTCKISSERPPHYRKTDPMRQRLCRQPTAKLTNGDSPPPIINHTVSQLLCIERTCQVFAKRIADALTFSLTAEPEVAGESLKSEAKHLQNTISTYMDDDRFKNIDFALIHSRLAQLVVYKLKQQTRELDDINDLVDFLVKLRCPNDDIFSSDDERKPTNFRGTNSSRIKVTQVIDAHVRCLASFLSEEFTENYKNKGPAVSESECVEIWDKAAKCRCDWKIEAIERNSKKNASFRKNRSALSAGSKNDSIVRRLSFDQDIGDGRLQAVRQRSPVGLNSPAGDNAAAALYTVDVAKCQVLSAQISEDETDEGSPAASSSDEFETASEQSSGDEMQEANDTALAEPFIYGSDDLLDSCRQTSWHNHREEPTKMDRMVYDAIADCDVNRDEFPNVYRWRHAVALFSPAQREKWPTPPSPDDSCGTGVWSVRMRGGDVTRPPWGTAPPCSPVPRPHSGALTPVSRSTPRSDARDSPSRNLSLQVSNWLRVTGPNSPRSALAAKNIGHNVSFGF